ncbi:MAG: hypothetical protein K6A44_04070 [bacterium]|nr:hypothetical protein [bacterium]
MFKKLFASILVAVVCFSYTGMASASVVASTAELPDVNEIASVADAPAASSASVQFVEVNNISDATVLKYENLPKVKNVSSNLVKITENGAIIPSGDVFKVAFAQNFTTKNLKEGDSVVFDLPKGLYTQEGRMLLPSGTQIVATVKSVTKPRSFNRNARVMLDFNEVLVPNATSCKMGACVYGKYNALQPSPWLTFVKPAAWTVGLFGVGAGLGAAIGAAASAAATGCLAIGMPVGGGVGLLIGLVTPGLHYRAKAGKQIPVMLTSDMYIMNK